MSAMDAPALEEAPPREMLPGSGIQAARVGDDVTLSFLVSEGCLTRHVQLAVPFGVAVRLSAQLRRALAEETAWR